MKKLVSFVLGAVVLFGAATFGLQTANAADKHNKHDKNYRKHHHKHHKHHRHYRTNHLSY